MSYARPYPVLMIVSALASVVASLLLGWHEQEVFGFVGNDSRSHSQAVWTYGLMETTESAKLPGYLLALVLWVLLARVTMGSSPAKERCSFVLRSLIVVVSIGLLVLFAAELQLAAMVQGYEVLGTLGMPDSAAYQERLAIVTRLVSAADLVFPLGLFSIWLFKKEGTSLLD